ncbi:acyltransferase family protein [Cryobacterium sp. SO2]|uniref:acyltransferase family protein n=1 Tax=Cryobacterium sp. SO2 TaxID=1897060 RepID=UPI00223D6863|nr:acyltransferase family protein [Cryobacterium sp. SO2]WEO76950.1 acyltransferase family protein [Cryobacterium sp. SO2]
MNAGAPPRETWIDVAKGIAIILVVLFHSVMYLDGAGVTGPLATLNPLLDTFRMPLFFFMSGLLAARAVALPFAALFRKRMLLLLYLYVLWVTLQTILLLFIPPISQAPVNARPLDLVTLFVRPNSNLWFIYALPLFFALAWLMRRWPPALQVTLTALVAAGFGSFLLHTGTPWDKMGRYLVFFIAAIWLGPKVRRLVPAVRWWHAAAAAGLYAAVTAVVVRLDLLRVPFVLLATSALAVTVGIVVSVLLARLPALDWLRALGTRTLPIYLVHTFPMILVAATIVATGTPSGTVLNVVLGTALPILLCAVAIIIALAAFRVFGRVPGLFTVPVTAWLQPVPARTAGPVRSP